MWTYFLQDVSPFSTLKKARVHHVPSANLRRRYKKLASEHHIAEHYRKPLKHNECLDKIQAKPRSRLEGTAICLRDAPITNVNALATNQCPITQ